MPVDRHSAASSGSRLRLTFVFVLSLILSGCVVGDFISVYFNIFYNASRLFDEAEKEVWDRPEVKKAGKGYLAPFVIPATTKTKLTSVIEKCSKLLQYHPDSRWVPDALIMIGKSYYYEDENQSAERKFNELIASYPGHPLSLEAKLWLAYAYYRMGEKDKAVSAGKAVVELSRTAGEDRILSSASQLLAQLAIEGKDYRTAEQYLELAAERSGNDAERAANELRLADTYALEDDFQNAERAFAEAEKVSNDYLGEYRARIGQARMLAKQKKYDQSLARLRTLRANLNYKEFFGEIDLERANVLRDKGDYAAAILQYSAVDTMYARTEFSASAYYEAGLLFEKKLMSYDSARVLYGRGKSESPAAAVTPLLIHRSAVMDQYALLSGQYQRYDSLLRVATAPVADSPGAARDTAVADSTKHAAPPVPPIPPDTLKARMAYDENELAGLFYTQLDRPDSAEYWFHRLLNDFPGSPFTPRAYYILAQISGQDSSRPAGSADSLYRKILKDYPESEFAVEAARILRLPPRVKVVDSAEVTYARAEALIDSGRSDAAIDSLLSIRERYPASPFAAKAQYAVGWLYDYQKNMPDSALASYQLLARLYPGSPYTLKVQPILAEVAAQKAAAAAAAAKDTSAKVEAKPPEPEKKIEPDQFRRLRARMPGRIPNEDTLPTPRLTPADTTMRRP